MGDSILLSEDRGVNPRLTVCLRCGGETSELILVGTSDWIHKCYRCGKTNLAPRGQRTCQDKKCRGTLERLRRMEEWEKLPAAEPCDACKEEIEEHKKVVEAGGIYFRCSDCDVEGVIKADAVMAKAVREQMGIDPPEPCGVEFSDKDCPKCGPEPVVEES